MVIRLTVVILLWARYSLPLTTNRLSTNAIFVILIGPLLDNSRDSSITAGMSNFGDKEMKSSPAWLETTKFGAQYTVRTHCPQCGRKHITVFRLRHVSDNLFVQLGQFFRYARHFDFLRLRWCTSSGQHPNWTRSEGALRGNQCV